MKQFHLTILALLFSFASYAVISPITGASSICLGGGTTLTDATTGGVWTSSNTAIATIGSASGIVNSVAAGTVTITYTTGTGFVTAGFTVTPLPTVFTLLLAGSGGICAGGAGTHIYLSGSQAGFTYQLFNSAGTVGLPITGSGTTIDFGSFSIPGSYTCVATNPTTSCGNNMGTVTLSILPTPGPISGPSGVCVGASTTLTDPVSGGTWTSTNPSVAAIGTTGSLSGIAVGTSTISYTLSSGCTTTLTVNVVNLVLPITGTAFTCPGSNTTLSDATAGGTWTSSNPSIATVGSTGSVHGVTAGTTAISYSVTGGCGTVGATVTVRPNPAAITGITSICAGAVSTLHDATTGGTWSSTNPSVATVGSLSGVVNSITTGTAGISYTVAGCSVTTTMAIDPTPLISGATGVCVLDTIILTTSIPGSWTSSNPGIATVGTFSTFTGVVNGLVPGTTVITCNSYSTGCVSTRSISVTSSCTGTPAGGIAHSSNSSSCSGTADLLYLTGASTTCGIGHQWQYSLDSISWFNVSGGFLLAGFNIGRDSLSRN